MKNSRESSILKSLAVSFGDGLAFGVGMKIAQATSNSRNAELPPVAETSVPPSRVPAGMEPLDKDVLEKVTAALEARVAGHIGQVDRRLAETEARLALEQSAQGPRLSTALKAYVDEQVRALEERLHTDIREAGDRTAALLVETIENRLLERLAELEAHMRQLGEEFQLTRSRANGAEQNLEELIRGLGRLCEQAIRRDKTPPPPSPAGEDAPPDPQVSEGTAAPETSQFESLSCPPDNGRGWRVPVFSSAALAVFGLLAAGLMH